jgi:protein gp37
MGKETGIKWTDSTSNPWIGCTKVENAPACIGCYAEGVDKRSGGGHWGHGAPRKRMVEHTRNEPLRWNRNADKFFAEHGRRQRVFTLSMGDLFDNEVDPTWRGEHLTIMERCDLLEWQICTKRVSNLPKMVPAAWRGEIGGRWPQNIGVLITVVTQKEADRDVPRLLNVMKKYWGIPWVGISYEPAQALVDFTAWPDLDWIIFGGKSGGQWNDGPFDLDWARRTRDHCAATDTAFFMKQVAAFRPTDDMIPADLMVRQWPRGH